MGLVRPPARCWGLGGSGPAARGSRHSPAAPENLLPWRAPAGAVAISQVG